MSVLNNQVDGARPASERPTSERATHERHASRSSASSQSSAEAPRKVSVLGKTLVFKGELSADEDIILQGRVEGSIHHTQSVTVGIDGVVIGDTHARTIVVEGTVEGDIKGVVSVLIAATATVRGNISAPRVGIMEGANFNGSVDMHTAVGAVRGSDANPRVEAVVPSSDTGLTDLSVERILGK
jgi:cytoskeletal protein CcmA (bactofilin family)